MTSRVSAAISLRLSKNLCRYQSTVAQGAKKGVSLNAAIVSPDGAEGNKNKLKNMVFLHGLLGSSSNWKTLGGIVSKQCLVNAHLLDARNHGASPHHEDMSYASMATDLHEYIVKNSLGRVVLLGHSMGGKAAIAFSTMYPELVEKLIVVDIAPVTYTGWTGIQNILDFLHAADIGAWKSRKDADLAARSAIPDPLTRGFVLQNLIPDPAKQQEFVWRVNVPVLRNSLQNIMLHPMDERSRFYGPTLYVKGGKSSYVSSRYEDQIKSVTPDYEITSIDDAGHYVHAEKPQEFISRIVPFIVHHK